MKRTHYYITFGIVFIILVSIGIIAYLYQDGGNGVAPSTQEVSQKTSTSTPVKPLVKSKEITTLLALMSHDSESAEAKAKTLQYVIDHSQEVTKYLVENEGALMGEKDREEFLAILGHYVFTSLGEKYYNRNLKELLNDPKAKTRNAPEMVRLTDSNLNINFETQKIDTNKYVLFVENMFISGAYNILTDTFLVTFDEGSISATSAPIVEMDKGALGMLDSYDNYNVRASDTPGVIVMYGMLPRGGYPCNEERQYVFVKDRFIFSQATQFSDCKTYNDTPGNETPIDYDKRSVVEKMDPMLFEKAKTVPLSTLRTYAS